MDENQTPGELFNWAFLEHLDMGDLAPIDEAVDLLRLESGFYLVLEGGERIGPYDSARAAVESGSPDPRVSELMKELVAEREKIADLTRERDRETERADAEKITADGFKQLFRDESAAASHWTQEFRAAEKDRNAAQIRLQTIQQQYDELGKHAEHLEQLSRKHVEERDVLVGWEQAVLSEGQAARLLGIDRLRLRELRDAAAERAGELWEQYRKEHPVEQRT